MKFLLAFILSTNLYGATQPSGCGTFDIYGVIEKNPNDLGYVFLVNKGSLSQYQFPIVNEEELKALPYMNRPIKVRAQIKKQVAGYRGELAAISRYEDVVLDPANLKGQSGFLPVKEEKCQ